MKSTMALVAAGTLVLSGFAGCERAEDANARRGTTPPKSTSTPELKPAPSTNTNTPGAGTGVTGNAPNLNTQMHDQALTAWKQQIRDVRGRVDQMKDKVDAYTGVDKEQIRSQFQQLQTQAAALETRVTDFKDTGTGSFDTFRSDVESGMTRISDKIRELDEKLAKPPAGNAPSTTPPPSSTPSSTPSPNMPSPTTPDVPKSPDVPKNPDMPQPTTPPNPNDPG